MGSEGREDWERVAEKYGLEDDRGEFEGWKSSTVWISFEVEWTGWDHLKEARCFGMSERRELEGC